MATGDSGKRKRTRAAKDSAGHNGVAPRGQTKRNGRAAAGDGPALGSLLAVRGGRLDVPDVPALFGEMRADWRMGSETRFDRPRPGLPSYGAPGDYHWRDEFRYYRAIEIAYDMARNDTGVGMVVRRLLQNVLQNGFSIDPQTPDSGLNAALKTDWLRWATSPQRCDSSGRFDFDALVWQAAFSDVVGGDAFVLPLRSGHVQLVEGYRCRSPHHGAAVGNNTIILGVELDAVRRPAAYWFVADELDPLRSMTLAQEPQRYAARGADGDELVWHVGDPQRYTETRYTSALASVYAKLGLLDDIEFAELVKLQMSACVVFFRQQLPGVRMGEAARTQVGERSTETRADGSTQTREKLAPGKEIQGRPGEQLQGFSPQITTQQDTEFMRSVFQSICAALDTPLISVLLDGRETNFSGWRGALDQAKIAWRHRQERLAAQLYRRAYRWRVAWKASRDAALTRAMDRLGPEFFSARINTPRWPYIEPLKDTEALDRRRKYLQTSPRRSSHEIGCDFGELVDETVADNQRAILAAIAAARQVHTDTGMAIDPVRFLYLDAARELGPLPELSATKETNQQRDDEKLEQPANEEGVVERTVATSDVVASETIRAETETPSLPSPIPDHLIRLRSEVRTQIPHLEQYLGLWGILPAAGEQLRQLVTRTDLGQHLARMRTDDVATRQGEIDAGGYKTTSNGSVAVIELNGPLSKYGSSLMRGGSMLETRRTLRRAALDNGVRRIVLLIDSPGGSMNGLCDLCDDVARINRAKPITAYIEDVGCSAAYFIASQARQIAAGPGAQVGSLGVFLVVEDLSSMAETLGVRVHVVKRGEYKGIGTPGAPVTDDQLAELQRGVDSVYDLFMERAAAGRGVSRERALAWGDGRVYLAAEAAELGLIDAVATFDDVLDALELGEDIAAPAAERMPVLV